MDISILGVLREGFRIANRSWPAIGFFAGVLVLVTILSIGVIAVTNPPVSSGGESSTRQVVPAATTDADAAAPASDVAAPAADTAAPGTETPAAGSDEVNLFDQLETTQPEGTPSAESPAPIEPAAPAADIGPVNGPGNEQAVQQWLARTWPAMALVFLLIMFANVWLSGGQIGYLAQQLNGPAKLSTFWQEGTAAFPRLIGGWGLLMLGAIGVLLALSLIGVLLNPLPDAVASVLGVLVLLALAAAGMWLVIRLSFWFIAIVVDRTGPLAGLKASWRVTKGHWWKVAKLALLIAVISFAVSLPFGLIEGLGQAVGGGAAVALGVAANIVGLIASLYVGFAALAAYIRFYHALKGQPAAVAPTPS